MTENEIFQVEDQCDVGFKIIGTSETIVAAYLPVSDESIKILFQDL